MEMNWLKNTTLNPSPRLLNKETKMKCIDFILFSLKSKLIFNTASGVILVQPGLKLNFLFFCVYNNNA